MINQMIKDVWAYFTNAQKIAFIALFVLSIILGLLIPVLLPNSSMRQIELSRSYVPGELSDEDVYSPQSVTFIDEIATERVRREASNAVLPYFSVNLLSTLQTVNLTRSYVQALNMNSATSPYAVLRDAGIDDTDITNRILNLSTQDRNLVTGLPKTVTVTSSETEEALREAAGQIVEAVIGVLEQTPPELSADILERGIVLTGGGALLRGLEELIAEKTGINTMTAEDPMKVVAIGTGQFVEFMSGRKEH